MKLPLEQICLMLNIFGFPYESEITLKKIGSAKYQISDYKDVLLFGHCF